MIASSLAVGPAQRSERTGVVVVGSGAAGLSAALALAARAVPVALVTKGALGDGASAWAQGGLAAVVSAHDSVGAHVQDTLAAGAGLCEPVVVSELAAAAPEAIAELIALGVEFDREPDGSLALGLEGGHRTRRIVHAGGDASGAAVVAALVRAVRAEIAAGRVALWERTTAVDVLDAGSASGVREARGVRTVGLDGTVSELHADTVVLATGGIGQAWPLTSNPVGATGDGLALALRAGAIIRDAEFVQFHPTVLAAGSAGQRTALVSEAVRGEGARLLDVHGRSVTAGVHPLGDLAPRDVVAAAIHRRMAATGADHVLLDATGFGERLWSEHFPTILALCLERGVDPRVEPMPVAPAAHYSCGGVLSDLDGVTSLPGLYAIGEVASTGVQGANRLASNGVTEAVIAGRRMARRLLDGGTNTIEVAGDGRSAGESGAGGDGGGADALLHPGRRAAVIAATGAGSGVLRDDAGLREQLATLERLRVAPAPQLAATDLAGAVETTNLHAVSTLVATAALARTESRGCHRRADHRGPSPEWHEHQLLTLRDGALRRIGVPSLVAA